MIESAPEERALEAVLRPKVLGEFVGQEKVVKFKQAIPLIERGEWVLTKN